MAETNGHDGKPASTGTPAAGAGNGNGSTGNGGNGGSRLQAVMAAAKATQKRAVEELAETVKAPE
jgi:hypothetical protein